MTRRTAKGETEATTGCVLMALALLYFSIWFSLRLFDAVMVDREPVTQGVVKTARVFIRRGRVTVDATVAYKVDRHPYETRIVFGKKPRRRGDLRSRQRSLRRRWSPGTKHKLYVDPDEPRHVWLKPPPKPIRGEGMSTAILLLFIGGFLLVGGMAKSYGAGGALEVFRRKRLLAPKADLDALELKVHVVESPFLAGDSPYLTRCNIYIAGHNRHDWQLEIRSHDEEAAGSLALGADTMVATGDTDFDDVFFSTTNDTQRLLRLLEPETVRTMIRELHDLYKTHHIVIGMNRYCITVRKRVPFASPRQLEDCLAHARAIANVLLEALGAPSLRADAIDTGGIVVLGASHTAGADAPLCQVCGDEITQKRIQCASCHTAHHEDCWEYLGHCSTYGCDSRSAN